MSFEGHFQILCERGHEIAEELFGKFDCDKGGWRCPHCRARVAWWNLVDTTNGSFEGNRRIDGYVRLRQIGWDDGHPIYRMPKKKGKKV